MSFITLILPDESTLDVEISPDDKITDIVNKIDGLTIYNFKNEDRDRYLEPLEFINCVLDEDLLIIEDLKTKGLWNMESFIKCDKIELIPVYLREFNIDKMNIHGMNPLFHNIYNNNLEMTQILVDFGADVYVTNNRLENILHLSVDSRNPNIEIIKWCLDMGIDIDSRNTYGFTPLHISIQNHNVKISLLLIEYGANPNIENNYGKYPLYESMYDRLFDISRKLVDKGANINQKNGNDGETAFLRAAKNGNPEILKFLIDVGADISITDICKNNALHYASNDGNLENVVYLLDIGFDINSQNNEGDTALHYAARSAYAHINVLEYLLKKGAKVNVANEDGNYPIHYSLDQGNVNVFDLLIEYGADPKAKNHKGMTIKDVAEFDLRTEFMDHIKKYFV